jgi:DNA-binding winged helix-turn-helix (wHTH) protein/Tol biopolymer transport system component
MPPVRPDYRVSSEFQNSAENNPTRNLKSSEVLRDFSKPVSSSPENQSSYEFGDFRVDRLDRVLLRDGELVPLTPKVFDLLLLLIENHGHVVGKDRLMKEVWPDTFVEEGNLTQSISVLRKALGEKGYIQTIPRRGYRFVGHIHESVTETHLIVEEHSRARVIIEDNNGDAPATSPADFAPIPTAVASKKPVGNKIAAAVVISVVLLVIVVAGLRWLRWRNQAQESSNRFDTANVTLQKLVTKGEVVYGLISSDGQFVTYTTLDENHHYTLWLQHVGSKEPRPLLADSEALVGPGAISHDNNWLYYGQVDPKEPAKGSTIFRMPLFGGTARKILEGVHAFAALSPDDQRLLYHHFTAPDGIEVMSASAHDGSDARVIAAGKNTTDFMGTRWSPDGTKLLFFRMEQRADGSYWSLHEMPADGGASKIILAPQQRKISFVDWVDEGRGIVMNATDPATKTPQLFYVTYPTGETTRITNDLFGYTYFTVAKDAILAGMVERQSKVWLTTWPVSSETHAAIDRDMADGLAWLPDGHIIYDAHDNARTHLWTADTTGGVPQQLSPENTEEKQPDVSPDEQSIAFLSRRSGTLALWLMNADGRNPRQLTADGLPWRPRFASDSQSVFFLWERSGQTVLARVSIAGGEPVIITDDVYSESFFDVSPEGDRVIYSTLDRTRGATRVVLRTLATGATNYFDIEPSYFVRWTPDGNHFVYAQVPADKQPGESLWLQSINGGAPREILNATPDLIYWLSWSSDGRQLALSRGRFTRDLVLITRHPPSS